MDVPPGVSTISAWWPPAADANWVSLPPHARSGRRLRVAIVTENFLPKVDGVTRTLARLLEHLAVEGHEVLVCGPATGVTSYAGHRILGTWGIPLVVYPGLKLNFACPRFLAELTKFQPDVVHFVDPIWLGAQMVPLVRMRLPGVPLVASYHTNIAVYVSLYGAPWLEKAIWGLTRSLHAQCEYTLCPSPSTANLLAAKRFSNLVLWPRGVDTTVFTPRGRDDKLRASWGCAEDTSYIHTPSPDTFSSGTRSPPPAYEAIGDAIPDAAFASFSLPPPAVSHSASAPEGGRARRGVITAAACELQHPSVVLLYVGRLSWEKNLRLLVASYAKLNPLLRARSQLVFVGDGPARQALETECGHLGLAALFLGHQRGRALAACYASADIFAFPSYTETFGQVVLEALASGLPVVGLAADGTADLVQHGYTGLLLRSEELRSSAPLQGKSEAQEQKTSPTALAFAAAMCPGSPTFDKAVEQYSVLLAQLIQSPAMRTSMGQAAATAASRRSWRDAMDCAVDGYHAALAYTSANERLSGEEQMSITMTSPIGCIKADTRAPPTRLLQPRNLIIITAIVATCALIWALAYHARVAHILAHDD